MKSPRRRLYAGHRYERVQCHLVKRFGLGPRAQCRLANEEEVRKALATE